MRTVLTGLLVSLVTLGVAGPASAAESAEVVARLLAAAPRGPDGARLFPADARIATVEGETVTLAGTFEAEPDEVRDALRLELLLGALAAHDVRSGVRVLLPDGRGGFRPLGATGPEATGPDLPPSPALTPGHVITPFARRLPNGGALSGRRIAISAGHGWLDDGAGGWRTQRGEWKWDTCGSCRGIIEDFFTTEFVTDHLIPLLHQMGAEVILVREPDHSVEVPVEVDNGDAAMTTTGPWADGTSAGGYGGDYQTLDPAETGEARYTLSFPTPGPRRVSFRWREGANRTTAARLTVHHAGGSTEALVDQTRIGDGWFDLGDFVFGTEGEVVLEDDRGDGFLIADAVRAGGGIFQVSGKPAFEMAAKSYVPWAGAPGTVTSRGDVTIRPAYAEVFDPDVYISIHANASGGAGGSSANGISTYRYSCQTYSDFTSSSAATGCDDPPGSTALLDLVQGQALARLRADWDPNFGDRGGRVANFGELRVLDDTPGILVETAFFDNVSAPAGSPPPKYPDNRSLHDPRWRETLAMGIATGLAQFFDANASAPPPRPTEVTAINKADGTVRVAWKAVPGATSYQVHLAAGGRGFSDGQIVTTPEAIFDALEPYEVYSVRVGALDANGEGFPSQAVAFRFRGATLVTGETPAPVLQLQGYDRQDAWVQVRDNDLTHATQYAVALGLIDAFDVFFDGATRDVVDVGGVDLSDYDAVIYSAGKNSTEHDSVSAAMITLLTTYVGAGGKLIISGEELGWDLVGQSTDATESDFFQQVLGATYVGDDANAYTMAGVAGGPFSDLPSVSLDDGTAGIYEVKFPDVLDAQTGATVVMTWPDGTGAAIATADTFVFGAGLEAVVPDTARADVLERALQTFVPGLPTGDLDLDGAPDNCETTAGLDWRDGNDGALDPDGDGVSSADECLAGTDPLNAPNTGGDGGTTDSGSTNTRFDPRVVAVVGGCGCTSGTGSGVSPLWASLVLLALRRRRR